MFQMEISKLNFDVLGPSEILHHVPSFDLFTNNRSTLGDGVLLYMSDTFNANKVVNISVRLQQLEIIFLSFSVGKINYAIGNIYRPPNSINDNFLSDLSNILNNALTVFPKSIFYIRGNFNCDLF